jgi:DNA polymerase III subunit delta
VASPAGDLARAPLRPFYLLYGEETFLVERALRTLQSRIDAEPKRGTCRTLWIPDDLPKLRGALDDLNAPLLFGGGTTLVVRHVEALVEGAQEDVLARLETIGGGSCLVLVGGAVDARRRLALACQRAGAVQVFAPLTDVAAVRRWVGVMARERGHAIDGTAVDQLLDRTGYGLGTLDMEIEKLSIAVGPGQAITEAAVLDLVGATRTRGVEELTDRLGRGDLAGALRIFRALMGDGEAPIRVLAFLAANLRRSLHVAEFTEMGLRPDEIGPRIGMPGWLVQKNLGRGDVRHLRRALRLLGQVDLDLKRSRPAEAVFERALFAVAPRR